MFDLGWTELLVIGAVALIVVGPKDLPGLFRNVGRFVGKARGMAREFTRAMEQAADESGVKEATSSFKDLTSGKNLGLDDLKDATQSFKDFSPDSETGRMSAQRAEDARKIHEHAAKKAEERLAAQAERAAQADSAAAADASQTKTAGSSTGAKSKAPKGSA